MFFLIDQSHMRPHVHRKQFIFSHQVKLYLFHFKYADSQYKNRRLTNVWCTWRIKELHYIMFWPRAPPLFIVHALECVLIIFVYDTFIVIAGKYSPLSKLVCLHSRTLMNEKQFIFQRCLSIKHIIWIVKKKPKEKTSIRFNTLQKIPRTYIENKDISCVLY